MIPKLAYFVLVMLFALPLQIVGLYWFRQATKSEGKNSGDLAYEFGWIFSAGSWGVILLGIIGAAL